MYTLTDEAKTYIHPDLKIVQPSFCPVQIDYFVPTLQNGENAITRTDETFEIYYDQDLTPIGQTLTVSISVTAKSLYPDPSDQILTEVRNFDVDFLNPCLDQDFVKIVMPEDIPPQEYIVFDEQKSFNHGNAVLDT